jgi:hypothetical protein
MTRLLDTPPEDLDELRRLERIAVIFNIARGRSEDEIYRRHIDMSIELAREEGADESDVEVVASITRRNVASVLAECAARGIYPEG